MSITLNWLDNSFNERGFVIERSTNGTSWSQYHTASIGITTYVDNNVTESNTYWYRLFSYNEAGTSSYSVTASLEYTASVTGSSLNNRLILDASPTPSEPYDVDTAAPSGSYSGSFGSGYGYLSAINCPNLVGLHYEDNFSFSTVNVSGSTNLIVLNINNNSTGTPAISSLDVSTNTNLQYLKAAGTHITGMDLSNNTALKVVELQNTDISTINLSNNTLLEVFTMHDCDLLTSITLPSTSTLSTVFCWGNTALTSIDISTCPELDTVDFSDCAFNQLQVDTVLDDVLQSGHSPSGTNYVDLTNYDAGSNAAPSVAGYATASLLSGLGWNIYTN